MIVSFDRSFEKSIDKLKNKQVAGKIMKLIDQLEAASDLKEISNVAKLKGYKSYYRIRIGDYRLVLDLIEPKHVILLILAHRKNVYPNLKN